MKAAVIKQHGPPESISFEDRSIPQTGANEVLIKVKACGLNHLDVWVRRGVPGHRFPLPLVPGSDIAGIIEQIGPEVTSLKPGMRVLVNPGVYCGTCSSCNSTHENLCLKWGLFGETRDGGCQEYLAVAESQVHPISEKLSFEKAACIPITYVTAWQMLVVRANAQAGERVLIHAAGSGVSVAAVQIAKYFGLQVFVTSRSDEKLQRAKNLSADRFINTKKENCLEAVRNLTGNQMVDIVIDHIGGSGFMDSVRCLRRGGRLVSCGATAGSDLRIDWKHVFFKSLTLQGSTYGTRKDFIDVLKHVEAGHFSPVIDSVVPLEDLSNAHRLIEEHKVFGKVVVRLNS